MRAVIVGLLVVLGVAPVLGQSGPEPTLAVLQERAAKRWPQPVRVGDVIGREVLEPKENQAVLGRVAQVGRRPDGGLELRISFGGVLGVGARTIAVPIEATALLGEYVVVVDYSRSELGRFPSAEQTDGAVAADETIRMPIVRPYH